MKKQTSTVISASQLVSAAKAGFDASLAGASDTFAQTFAAMLAGLGIVQVNAHPESVPPVAAQRVTRAQRVTSTPAPVAEIHAGLDYMTKETHPGVPRADRKAFNQALFKVKREAQASDAPTPAKVTRRASAPARQESAAPASRVTHARTRPASVKSDVPTVTVSDTYRTRLPKALFDAGDGRAFAEIILVLPSGEEESVTCDAEGRSRVPSAWLGDAGQTIAFVAEAAGVYICTVTDAGQASARVTHARPAARQTVAPAKVTRAARPKCVSCHLFVKAEGDTCKRCLAGQAQASGVVAAGTRAEARAARVTPRMVSMPGNLSAARTRAIGQAVALTRSNAGDGTPGSAFNINAVVARVIKGAGLNR